MENEERRGVWERNLSFPQGRKMAPLLPRSHAGTLMYPKYSKTGIWYKLNYQLPFVLVSHFTLSGSSEWVPPLGSSWKPDSQACPELDGSLEAMCSGRSQEPSHDQSSLAADTHSWVNWHRTGPWSFGNRWTLRNEYCKKDMSSICEYDLVAKLLSESSPQSLTTSTIAI